MGPTGVRLLLAVRIGETDIRQRVAPVAAKRGAVHNYEQQAYSVSLSKLRQPRIAGRAPVQLQWRTEQVGP